jgi:hypothetical protein
MKRLWSLQNGFSCELNIVSVLFACPMYVPFASNQSVYSLNRLIPRRVESIGALCITLGWITLTRQRRRIILSSWAC